MRDWKNCEGGIKFHYGGGGGGGIRAFWKQFQAKRRKCEEKKREWGEMLGWSGNIILTPDELSYSPNRYIATLW